MRVLPAINAPDEAGVIAALAAVRGATDMVHLDISDGVFTKVVAGMDPARWQEVAGDLRLQVHLMVAEPEPAVAAWLRAGAAQVVVHRESFGMDAAARIAVLAAQCKEAGAELILAGGIATLPETLLAHATDVSGFLCLAVEPGYSGRGMDPGTPAKVASLRAGAPDRAVWVDGGVNAATIASLRDADATGAVASHAVFGADDPVAALAALQLS